MSVVARHLVDCPEWRWIEGMGVRLDDQWFGRVTVQAQDGDEPEPAKYDPRDVYGEDEPIPAGAVPDLTDWATVGCMIGILRGRVAADVVITSGLRPQHGDCMHLVEVCGKIVGRAPSSPDGPPGEAVAQALLWLFRGGA